MPYTENHLLLRWGGSAWAGQETWSCSVRLRQAGGTDPGQMLTNAQDAVEDVAAVVNAYVDRQGTKQNSSCLVEYVQLNPISATTGNYLFPNSPVEFLVDPPNTSGGTLGYPQIAYCVTLRASLYRRGPAALGRWYVPAAATNPLLTSTGVMAALDAQAAADSAGTFLQDLTQLTGLTDPNLYTPWLFGDGDGGPRDSPILDVQVGNVYDTQRRRRRQIDETYSTSTTWNGGV